MKTNTNKGKYEIVVISEDGSFRIPYAEGRTIKSAVRKAVRKIFDLDLPEIEKLKIEDDAYVRQVLSYENSTLHLMYAPEDDLVVEDPNYDVLLYKPLGYVPDVITRLIKRIDTLPATEPVVMIVPFGYYKANYLRHEDVKTIIKGFLEELNTLDEFATALHLITNGIVKKAREDGVLVAYKNMIDPTIISAIVESPIEIPITEDIYFMTMALAPFNLIVSIGEKVPLEYRKIVYSFCKEIAKKDTDPRKLLKRIIT